MGPAEGLPQTREEIAIQSTGVVYADGLGHPKKDLEYFRTGIQASMSIRLESVRPDIIGIRPQTSMEQNGAVFCLRKTDKRSAYIR
jgi:hypothetical protein